MPPDPRLDLDYTMFAALLIGRRTWRLPHRAGVIVYDRHHPDGTCFIKADVIGSPIERAAAELVRSNVHGEGTAEG